LPIQISVSLTLVACLQAWTDADRACRWRACGNRPLAISCFYTVFRHTGRPPVAASNAAGGDLRCYRCRAWGTYTWPPPSWNSRGPCGRPLFGRPSMTVVARAPSMGQPRPETCATPVTSRGVALRVCVLNRGFRSQSMRRPIACPCQRVIGDDWLFQLLSAKKSGAAGDRGHGRHQTKRRRWNPQNPIPPY